MKTLLKILAVTLVILFTSCNQTSTKFKANNFKQENITYVKDRRTNLCYAILAGRNTGEPDQTGLGLACVPCEKVEDYIEN